MTELTAAMIAIHGLCTFLADVYCLLDQPRKIKEAIYIRKEGAQSVNHDEGTYQLHNTAFLACLVQVLDVPRTGKTSISFFLLMKVSDRD